MKKILILGSKGFIGRNLKEYFLRSGDFKVLAPTHQELDLLDVCAVKEYLEKNPIDVVFHCAVFGAKTILEEPFILERNLRLFYNLEKCHRLYDKMIYFGSGAEFDKRFDICSVKEEEIGKSIPTSPYGLAKYIIGKQIESSDNIYNFRIWGMFGKYEEWQTTFISGCCCKAIKGYPLSIRQDAVFDYLWIDDFCKIAEWSVTHNFKYHTYNLGSGNKIKLSQLAEIVLKVCGKRLDTFICKDGLGKEYTADSSRFLEEYGAEYSTPIEIAVGELYKWYEENQKEIDMLELIYG
ncbi:MAG: NAD-dependent epimerase/dehydratase family protein [Roseburia sp.]|nr:NAD-dependent epimerase/dehydratase family protein [Roseburia sp.]